MHEKTLTQKTVFSGKLLRIEIQDVELENGEKARREFVRHAGAVAVLARMPDGRLVLVRQFRKAVERIMLEVCAGILDPGEAPEEAARRELKEETGFDARKLTHLGRMYPSPGYTDEVIDAYYAEVEGVPGEQKMDSDERVEVVMMAEQEFMRKILRGEVEDAKTLAAWTLYKARFG